MPARICGTHVFSLNEMVMGFFRELVMAGALVQWLKTSVVLMFRVSWDTTIRWEK